MSTHVLDKQIDKMLRDKGVSDGMAYPVCECALVAGWLSRLCLCCCHLLLALVDLSTEAL